MTPDQRRGPDSARPYGQLRLIGCWMVEFGHAATGQTLLMVLIRGRVPRTGSSVDGLDQVVHLAQGPWAMMSTVAGGHFD